MRARQLLVGGTFITTCAVGLCGARTAQAAPEPPARVSVLTMGPGDHPFTRFGHNAFLLEWDDPSRRAAVYNFGTFEFDGWQGVKDFMAGRFRYWLSVGSLEGTRRTYAAENRTLTAQELALSETERAKLFAALTDNARPEHRYYDYDYYRDNCSTRVRDAIDNLLGGALRRGVVGPGRESFRQHTLALVADTPWLYFGLDLALGSPTDSPTTRWQELFLPQELHDALGRSVRVLDGQRTPLVRVERTLLSAHRQPLPSSPPTTWPAFLGAGTALGACLVALGRLARERKSWRVAFGATMALLGTLVGLLGSALAFFWVSKHWAAHANPSLLACPPWSLALGAVGLGAALDRPKSWRALGWVLGLSCMTSGALLLWSLSGHASPRMALLFLPLWAGCWQGARFARGQR